MKSIASSPGKVILFGEHFVVYGVKAILAAINIRVVATSSKTNEKLIKIKSNLGQIEIPTNESISKVNSLWKPFFFISKKMIVEFDYDYGIELVIDSDIPSGVGLGSSSACCVAAAASISKLFTLYTKEEIRNLAIQAEKTIFPNTSGADCTVCTFGGLIVYDKEIGFDRISSKPKFHLVIANTKKTHSTRKIVSKVKNFKKQNESIFSSLCNNESKLIEKVRNDLEKNDLPSLGKSMSENQKYLKQIGISNKKLNKIALLAEKTSYGAKLTGAGDGGCIIALVDEFNLESTVNILKERNLECFSALIDFKGLDTF